MQNRVGKVLEFYEAWRHVMSNAHARAWVFNKKAPTAMELILGARNPCGTFIISALGVAASETAEVHFHEQPQNRLDE